MATKGALESTIVKSIRTYLNSLEGMFTWKEHGGMYGNAGIPDVLCCYRGRFIAFEVKRRLGLDATDLQQATMRRIRAAGGVAEVVHSVSEVKQVLEKLRN